MSIDVCTHLMPIPSELIWVMAYRIMLVVLYAFTEGQTTEITRSVDSLGHSSRQTIKALLSS